MARDYRGNHSFFHEVNSKEQQARYKQMCDERDDEAMLTYARQVREEMRVRPQDYISPDWRVWLRVEARELHQRGLKL